jgi:hypothetical protein
MISGSWSKHGRQPGPPVSDALQVRPLTSSFCPRFDLVLWRRALVFAAVCRRVIEWCSRLSWPLEGAADQGADQALRYPSLKE